MGGGLSATDKVSRFAYNVVVDEYERLKLIFIEIDSVFPDDVLFNTLLSLYNSALIEYNLPIVECRASGVVASKYLSMTDDERNDYENLVLDAVNSREKKNQALKKAAGAGIDYDKCFGGTAADSKNEAEAAKLLRGDAAGSGAPDVVDPLLDPRNITYNHVLQEKTLRSVGKWKKFLGLGATKEQDCWMYINVLTKEVVSIRPSEYEDDANITANANANIATDPKVANPSNGLLSCSIAGVLECVQQIVRAEETDPSKPAPGKTPLLLDTSPNQALASFYTYKGSLVVSYALLHIKCFVLLYNVML
jgi:hypothetical protein